MVAEETGRSVAPVPYLGSAVVATTALIAAVEPEPARRPRPQAAAVAGERHRDRGASAVPFESAPDSELPRSVRVTGAPPAGQAASF